MIKLARFTNYKLLRSVEIPLGRLNVIVGANGVGKSSVLEGMHHLLQLGTGKHPGDGRTNGRAGLLFRGDRDPESLCSHATQEGASTVSPVAAYFELEVQTVDDIKFRLRAYSKTPAAQPRPFVMGLYGKGLNISTDFGTSLQHDEEFFAHAHREHLGSVVRLRLDATALAESHYSEEAIPRIEYDGTGLASVLQYLQGTRDGTIERIEKDLAGIVPGAKRIRSLPARLTRNEKVRIVIEGQETMADRVREVTGARFEVEWTGAGWIPAKHLSEGTLLTVGVLTMLHFRPPRLILLDAIDKALHPTAQRSVVELLKEILDRHTDLQIVATAHSPFVLDALEPEDVLVAASVAPGITQIMRLQDHPSWARRADYLKPGEFWSAVGEGWVGENKA